MPTVTSRTSSPSREQNELEMVGVDKRFGPRLAVEDLCLRVPAGEIYGLLGHNGAGKSTAIGMMLGQVWPTRGRILVQGNDVTSDRQRALAQVGAIFESPAFYDYLSGYRNLVILSSYSAPTPRRRILEILDWVGLGGRQDSKVRTYSHGMRARLALAQALLPSPRFLILDEPSDGLDPEGIHEMRQTILRLHRELGLTILLSSHLLNEVEQLCTRIAVLNQGRKVFDGTLVEITSSRSWLRLKVCDFDRASALLSGKGLIRDSRAGRLLAPAEHVQVDVIVKTLVEHGFKVYEVAPENETLENFYLSLMQREDRAPGKRS